MPASRGGAGYERGSILHADGGRIAAYVRDGWGGDQVMTDRRKSDDLPSLIEKSVAEFNALPEAEQREIRRQQRESWVRGEMSWPKPKYKWIGGAKVYDSLDDYYNG